MLCRSGGESFSRVKWRRMQVNETQRMGRVDAAQLELHKHAFLCRRVLWVCDQDELPCPYCLRTETALRWSTPSA